MNKYIKILEDKDDIIICIDGKESSYPIVDFGAIRSNSNKLSDEVIHWSERPNFKSEQLRNEILIPLAVLIEKHRPKKINWYETFLLAEANLNEAASENNDSLDEIDIDYDINKALVGNEPFFDEVNNAETKRFIETYLTKFNLPLKKE